jgi:ATP-dependent Clp protease ATP-binding subunit ClpX
MKVFFLSAKPETYHIDTSNILFIVSGAFVGLDNVVKRRVTKGVCLLQFFEYFHLTKCNFKSIGFTAPLASSDDSTHSDSKGLPFFTPNKHRHSNVLDLLEPAGTLVNAITPYLLLIQILSRSCKIRV